MYRTFFQISSELNNMVIDDMTRSSTFPGGYVHMYPSHGGGNQYWYYHRDSQTIRAMQTDLCLSYHGKIRYKIVHESFSKYRPIHFVFDRYLYTVDL